MSSLSTLAEDAERSPVIRPLEKDRPVGLKAEEPPDPPAVFGGGSLQLGEAG